ncbi:MAG: class I SAM-dependent methyltransferase [Candidatus Kryptoniota bacterium]
MFETGYYKNQREDVAAIVATSAVTVLDVGCGYGFLGSLLKSRRNDRTVVGIEKNHDAAEHARQILNDVFNIDIETDELSELNFQYDYIIFADILEHLRDPLSILIKFRKYLKDDGKIVCSIPNMRHYTVLLRLLKAGWEYEDYGLFDRTHIRFFSLRSMTKLILDAGFSIEVIRPKVVASKKMRILNLLFFDKLNEFVAMQYIIRAKKR